MFAFLVVMFAWSGLLTFAAGYEIGNGRKYYYDYYADNVIENYYDQYYRLYYQNGGSAGNYQPEIRNPTAVHGRCGRISDVIKLVNGQSVLAKSIMSICTKPGMQCSPKQAQGLKATADAVQNAVSKFQDIPASLLKGLCQITFYSVAGTGAENLLRSVQIDDWGTLDDFYKCTTCEKFELR